MSFLRRFNSEFKWTHGFVLESSHFKDEMESFSGDLILFFSKKLLLLLRLLRGPSFDVNVGAQPEVGKIEGEGHLTADLASFFSVGNDLTSRRES